MAPMGIGPILVEYLQFVEVVAKSHAALTGRGAWDVAVSCIILGVSTVANLLNTNTNTILVCFRSMQKLANWHSLIILLPRQAHQGG